MKMDVSSVDDEDIEGDIQRALDALSLENDDDDDDESTNEGAPLMQDRIGDDDFELTNETPACLDDFIQRVQGRAEGIQEELTECDALLASIADVGEDKREDYFCHSEKLQEFAFEIGEDPEELRDRVIQELEVDDSRDRDCRETPGIKVLSLEGPLFDGDKDENDEETATPSEVSASDSEAYSSHKSVQRLEAAAKRTVREFEDWYESSIGLHQERYEMGRRAAAKREQMAEKRRAERVRQNNDEQRMVAQQRLVNQTALQNELEYQKLETERLMSQYQSEIEAMDAQTKREKLAFLQERLEYQKTLSDRMEASATKIQAVYRSYRARKPYRDKLKVIRETARKKLANKRQMEIALERKALEQQKKKDREERRRREEEERRRQEEERLKKEAAERVERVREQERALEQKREQERLEAEKVEWQKQEDERREQEEREMEGKANAILEKIAREKKHDDEEKAKGRMNIHEGVSNIHGMRVVDNHDDERGGDGWDQEARKNTAESSAKELVDENLRLNKEDVGHEDVNVHGAEASRKLTDEDGDVAIGPNVANQNGEKLDSSKDAISCDGGFVIENMNINEEISEGMDSDEDNNQLHKGAWESVAEAITAPDDVSNNAIGPAVKVTIVTDKVMNNSRDNDKYNMHRTGTAKVETCETQNSTDHVNERTKPNIKTGQTSCQVGSSDDQLGNTPAQSYDSHTEYSLAKTSKVGDSTETEDYLSCHEHRDEAHQLGGVRNEETLEVGREMGKILKEPITGKSPLEECGVPGSLQKSSVKPSESTVEAASMDAIEQVRKVEPVDGVTDGSRDCSEQDVPIGQKTGALIGQTQLPDAYERARIRWMETSVPFSKCLIQAKDGLRTLEKRKRRPLRRPSAIKKMAALSEEKLLEASPDAESLAEVTSLTLSELTDCTLSTITSCPRLKALSCKKSCLHGLEGFEQSPDLSYIDATGNAIAFTNCRDLPHLVYLDLSGNHLSTIHGLEGCTTLKWLNLSRNKITRLGGVESLISIVHLDLSQNQLINAQGLSSLVHLTSLDLSGNHLSSVPDLGSCPLLQRLNLGGNSISKPPELSNHVLLMELLLDNNSLVTMETIRAAWLPRLQMLSLAQNSLPAVPVLEFAPLLARMDLSNNYISDICSLKDGLSKLPYLEELYIDGNPVTEEKECRNEILRLIPDLSRLDQEVLSAQRETRLLSQFEVMCHSQVEATSALQERCDTVLRRMKDDASHLVNVSDIWGRFLDQSQKMAVDHRYMHEYGDLSPVQFSATDLSRVIPDPGCDSNGGKSDAHSESETSGKKTTGVVIGDATNLEITHSCNNRTLGGENVPMENRSNKAVGDCRNCKSEESSLSTGSRDPQKRTVYSSGNTDSAVVAPKAKLERGAREHSSSRVCDSGGVATSTQNIQNPQSTDLNSNMPNLYSRGVESSHTRHKSRTGIGPSARDARQTAAMKIQSLWRGFQVRRDIALHTKRYLAAVAIQATWRGHAVRQRYQRARAALQKVESDEGEDFGDEDVDLEFLEFNEDTLDKEWFPTESPSVPSSHPVLPPSRGYPSPPSHRPVSSVAMDTTSGPSSQRYMPHPPKQAWKQDTTHNTLTGKPPLPPVTPSTGRGESTIGSTARTVRSRKEQQLSEEWGFKDNVTAELMMKRARKMNRANKKKSLDPMQKLKVLKKAQDLNTSPVTQTRRGVQRRDYFKAKEETRDSKDQGVTERTYQWVHSQTSPGVQPTPISNPYRGIGSHHSSSEPNLPRMSPDVLQGRVQLMASPSLELESVDGLSVQGGAVRGRSNSLTSTGGGRNQLLSLTTNSAPSDHTRQRQLAARSYKNR